MAAIIRPIKGLVSVISGGGSGIGRGVAERLYNQGSKVAVFDLPNSNGPEVVKQMGDLGFFQAVDVSYYEKIGVR